ncbi:MAG: HlyD family efflux transporter periplasmic adaptor subunit [Leptolyngbya sp. SIO4C1]|nr:HlyD family efflux transporter periplasmic adaptor subunit [Leptolyngbya sp. SIO4C1]
MVSQSQPGPPPAQLNDFLPPVKRWTTLGGLLILLTVGLAVPILSVVKYKTVIKAQASLRPDGELRLVQAATAGQITQIAVKEHQRVEQGDIIAQVDGTHLQTQQRQLQISLEQAQQQQQQINAQIGALDRQISAETNRIGRTVTVAEAELSRRQRAYQDRQVITAAEMAEAEASLRSAEAALAAARSKRDRYQRVAEQGALSLEQLEEAQLAVQQQAQITAAAQARVASARTALAPSAAEVAIAAEQISQEKASGQAALAVLAREREALIQQRIQINEQIARHQRESQQVARDLQRTAIAAPVDGTVFKLTLRNPSQTVQPGEEIAQIAPSDAPLTIKAAVSPQDVGQLQAGQPVQMRVSACPYPDYGTLKGVVDQVSRDTIKAQTAAAQSPAFYAVTIQPEKLSLGSGKRQCRVQLGMEGRADIVTREETVLRFLLRKARLSTNL